jgi:hypothetical protein
LHVKDPEGGVGHCILQSRPPPLGFVARDEFGRGFMRLRTTDVSRSFVINPATACRFTEWTAQEGAVQK